MSLYDEGMRTLAESNLLVEQIVETDRKMSETIKDIEAEIKRLSDLRDSLVDTQVSLSAVSLTQQQKLFNYTVDGVAVLPDDATDGSIDSNTVSDNSSDVSTEEMSVGSALDSVDEPAKSLEVDKNVGKEKSRKTRKRKVAARAESSGKDYSAESNEFQYVTGTNEFVSPEPIEGETIVPELVQPKKVSKKTKAKPTQPVLDEDLFTLSKTDDESKVSEIVEQDSHTVEDLSISDIASKINEIVKSETELPNAADLDDDLIDVVKFEKSATVEEKEELDRSFKEVDDFGTLYDQGIVDEQPKNNTVAKKVEKPSFSGKTFVRSKGAETIVIDGEEVECHTKKKLFEELFEDFAA